MDQGIEPIRDQWHWHIMHNDPHIRTCITVNITGMTTLRFEEKNKTLFPGTFHLCAEPATNSCSWFLICLSFGLKFLDGDDKPVRSAVPTDASWAERFVQASGKRTLQKENSGRGETACPEDVVPARAPLFSHNLPPNEPTNRQETLEKKNSLKWILRSRLGWG